MHSPCEDSCTHYMVLQLPPPLSIMWPIECEQLTNFDSVVQHTLSHTPNIYKNSINLPSKTLIPTPF